jgi:uncharacterized protein (DUF362 family)/NAD-dependent dihydropyrimidine dehydrogenase PreA subunit
MGRSTMMRPSKVAVVRCPTYDEPEVLEAVRTGIELLGGIDAISAPGEQILLKPNVLAGDPPERCVCTHPAVLKAVGRLFLERGCNVSYGDSPGHGDPLTNLTTAGLTPAAEELGLDLSDFDQGRRVENGLLVANGVLASDGIVSLSKLKTHMVTRMTGAVKNLYGCIPGQAKRRYHFTHPTAFDFSQMLVDLNLFLKAKMRLHIMDGVMAMEGNGPRNGDPVSIGVLLFSTDPVALDTVMCELIELDPMRMTTNGPGGRRGLGTYNDDEIEVVGDSLKAARPGSFNVKRGTIRDFSSQGLLARVDNTIARRPVLDKDKCTRCGQCVQACPARPKALDWHRGNRKEPPRYTYSRCIRCYCCQEICPAGAISIKRTFLRL